MSTTTVFIRNMVTLRCKMILKLELDKLGLKWLRIELGQVDLETAPTAEQFECLKRALLETGLEIIDDKKAVLIEKIKAVVIEMVHYANGAPSKSFSEFLREKLGLGYTYLANTFMQVNGVTIEQFIILHKVERIKELLIYDELNISEIANEMHYSSSAHLSNQFKRMTGLTPSAFKVLKQYQRKNLDEI